MDELQEALNRLDKLSNELHKVRNAIIAIQEGNEITESFDDEVFCEDAKERKQVSALLARIIEHLFKIQFSDLESFDTDWANEIENKFRSQIIDITEWCSKKPDKTLINSLRNNLQDIYETAIALYKRDAKKYSDLREGISLIPSECPWTLEALLDSEVNDLLAQLLLKVEQRKLLE